MSTATPAPKLWPVTTRRQSFRRCSLQARSCLLSILGLRRVACQAEPAKAALMLLQDAPDQGLSC